MEPDTRSRLINYKNQKKVNEEEIECPACGENDNYKRSGGTILHCGKCGFRKSCPDCEGTNIGKDESYVPPAWKCPDCGFFSSSNNWWHI